MCVFDINNIYDDHSQILPVVLVVQLVAVLLHQPQQLRPQVAVVRLLLELHALDVVHDAFEGFGQALQQLAFFRELQRARDGIGLAHVGGNHVHPWELALDQVDQGIDQTLQFIPPAEASAVVVGAAAESEAAAEVVDGFLLDVLAVGEVGPTEFEVHQVDLVLHLVGGADEEVAGLDVSVQKPVLVDELDPFQHLQSHHQGALEGEPASTSQPQVFEVGSELIENQVEPAVAFEAFFDFGDAVEVGLLDLLIDFQFMVDGGGVGSRVGFEHVALAILVDGALDDLAALGLDDFVVFVFALNHGLLLGAIKLLGEHRCRRALNIIECQLHYNAYLFDQILRPSLSISFKIRMRAFEQEKSAFHLYREHYQPRVPSILNQTVLENQTKPATVLPQIAEIFPNLANKGIKSVSFSKGAEKDTIVNALRIGCVLSGGQAAGGHNVIVGLYEYIKKRHKNSQLFGFLNGPKGIFTGNYIELTDSHINYYKNRGGFDMICSGRDKIKKEEEFQKSLQHCESLKLDGLVVIGGDDSNTNAALLAEYFLKRGSDIRVVGCPKTIDGDLKNEFVEVSFGFDTACKTYSECIGSLMADTLSSKKYYHFVRLMGRSASHIALECALLTKPTYAFIGEEVQQKNQTLKELVSQLIEIIVARSQAKKNYGIVLIPEGLIEFIPEMNVLIKEINEILAKSNLPKDTPLKEIKLVVLDALTPQSKSTFEFMPDEIASQLLLDRDPHGNVQVAKIETEKLIINLLRREISSNQQFQGKFQPLSNYFGYEGRCAFPTTFDCDYCYSLGLNAAAIIESGQTGLMSCVRGLDREPEEWQAGGFPLVTMMNLERRDGKNNPVIKKALVELEGDLFKIYEQKRKQWALGDYFNIQGPIQYEFPNPRPYLAVTPTQKDFDESSKEQGTEKSFAPVHEYNLNPLTLSLSKEESQIPQVLSRGGILINESENINFDSKEQKIAIQKDYPFLSNVEQSMKRLLTFGASSQPNEGKKLRIGISFNGRQFPGGHNIVKGLLAENTEVIGFIGGTKGISKQEYLLVDSENIKLFNNQSGLHLLGRTRDQLRSEEELRLAHKCCEELNLDGLVLVGASHTLTDATNFTNYLISHNCKTRVIGIPASIDNNVHHHNLEACVGFATSSQMYSTLISNLMIDASSNTKYWYFIRLMGRDPSHLALECTLSTRPNYAIISEEVQNKGWDLEQLVEDIARVIVKRQEKGLGFGCIIIPEGLPQFIPSLRRIKTELDQIKSNDENVIKSKMSEWAYDKYKTLPESIKLQLTLRDDGGALAFSQIETEKLLSVLVGEKLAALKAQKKYTGSFSPVCHFFGYQGRSAIPNRLDQNLGVTYAKIAKVLIEQNYTGYCTSVRGLNRPASQWFPLAIPLIHMLTLKEKSQFGVNKPIVRSANVDLHSASFTHYLSKREQWELNDLYESPGPIQFYGEMKDYIPITYELEERYDFEYIGKIEQNLEELKKRSQFGAESKKLKLIYSNLQNLINTLQILDGS